MSKQITPKHLAFLEEAKNVFSANSRRETYRSEDEDLIALRYGEDRDCIKIYELNDEVAFFVQQILPSPSFRNELWDFAKDMEQQLKVNDFKGGWKNEHIEFLLKEMRKNYSSLLVELNQAEIDKYEIAIRCANIANFAMMVADNEGEHL